MSDIHANYLLDLGRLLRDASEQAKRDAINSPAGGESFQKGRLMAYYEMLTLMQQQAIAFDLPLADLALDGLDPDRDLI